MCAGLLRVVAVMQDERPLGEEEEKESQPDQPGNACRVPDRVDRFGQNVEETSAEDKAENEP